jgi:hypothetical protein
MKTFKESGIKHHKPKKTICLFWNVEHKQKSLTFYLIFTPLYVFFLYIKVYQIIKFSHIFQKIHEETIIDIFSTRTPRRKKNKIFRFGQMGGKLIIDI